MTQNTSSAVMQQRHDGLDALDDFPTPPWATRAVIEHGILPLLGLNGRRLLKLTTVREPCANRGFMVLPLMSYFHAIHASDVHDYGAGFPLNDYLLPGALEAAEWTFMNPPFNLAAKFVHQSFRTPSWMGTAAFVRTAFLEGASRYRNLFEVRPPTQVLQHVERVILHKGKLRNPDIAYRDETTGEWRKPSTATSYCWIIWIKDMEPQSFGWIPPCRKALEREGDYPIYGDEKPTKETHHGSWPQPPRTQPSPLVGTPMGHASDRD